MTKSTKYQHVVNGIIEDINKGIYSANDQIPTEEELGIAYNVSRVTVRKAIEILVEQGYLDKKQGKGTFIKKNIIKKQLNETASFFQSTLIRGDQPSTVVHELKLCTPDPYISKLLKVNSNTPITKVKRVRLTNGFPMIYEEAYFVNEYTGAITEDMASTSIFSALKKRMHISHTEQEIDAISATDEFSSLLQVPVGFPLLRSVMLFYNDKNELFELAINYHRTDRIKLSIYRDISG